MPVTPTGEADLRALADRFVDAEAGITVWLAEAAGGDQRRWLTQALEVVAALRRLDLRGPVVTAYLHEHPEGSATAVRDLAGSLAVKLDRGVVTATENTRDSFRTATPENVEEVTEDAVTAHVDGRGSRWYLGRWAGG
jgi:hypothetical protein